MEASEAPPPSPAVPATRVDMFRMIAVNPPQLIVWADPNELDLEDERLYPSGIAETDPGDLSDVQLYLRTFYSILDVHPPSKAKGKLVDVAIEAYLDAIFLPTDALLTLGEVRNLIPATLLEIVREMTDSLESTMLFARAPGGEAPMSVDMMMRLTTAGHLLIEVHEQVLLKWGEITRNWQMTLPDKLFMQFPDADSPRAWRDVGVKLAEAGRAFGARYSEALEREARAALDFWGVVAVEGPIFANTFRMLGYWALREELGHPVTYLRFPMDEHPRLEVGYDPEAMFGPVPLDRAMPLLIDRSVVDLEPIGVDHASAETALAEAPPSELFLAGTREIGVEKRYLLPFDQFELLDEVNGSPLWIVEKPPGRLETDVKRARLVRLRRPPPGTLL